MVASSFMVNATETTDVSSSSNPVANPDNESHRSFTLFPKLPIEIRLMIWRSTFPRNGSFDLHDLASRPFPQERHPSGFEPLFSAPPTLYANRESRQETLKHYFIFHDEASGSSDNLREPVYFNTKLDQVYVLACKLDSPRWNVWLEFLEGDGVGTGLLGQIECLEVRFGRWGWQMKREIEREMDKFYMSFLCPKWGQLTRFSALKRLVLAPGHPPLNEKVTHAANGKLKGKEEMVGCFEAFLEFHKHKFIGGVPLVTVRVDEARC